MELAGDHRLLACATAFVPLWRTDPLYHELKESHSFYEAQHDWWRDRYEVAADDLGVPPKIHDIGWHRLRANVAGLVDWLRICYREGWLGKPRRNHLGTERKFRDRASKIVEKLAKMRVRRRPVGGCRRPRVTVAAKWSGRQKTTAGPRPEAVVNAERRPSLLFGN